jgi:N-methylhydantoinase A
VSYFFKRSKGGKMVSKEKYIIYIDNGGTFTDCFLVKGDGSFLTGKASTTLDDLSECFVDCLQYTAGRMDKPLEEVMPDTEVLGFGTTAGTNTLLTRRGAPKIGFITTKGTEDTTMIMRAIGRVAGLTYEEAMNIAGPDKPEPLIPRPLIKGVTERIDSKGAICIPLYEDEVRQAVKELLDEKVEGIAVSLLWSFLNEAHEKRIKDIINEMAPELPVALGVNTAPLEREYARCNSAIINLYLGPPIRKLFSTVKGKLARMGYRKPLLVMQAAGGLSKSDVVQPITTLHSGPVGGLLGVDFLRRMYGFKNALGCDVGGTSFDISILPEEGPKYIREPVVARFHVANPMMEIISIGAGGGTIAYVDEITGQLRVGPHSAGAVPGPACYGRGGVEPTVTDADVVMNRIDPDYFLGGTIKLDRDKAYKAIKEKVADKLGMEVMEAAQAICDIIDNIMGETMSSTLRERGLNPADFVIFAFGGAGPTHCCGFSAQRAFQKVIVTPYAATFSAFGATTADISHRYEASPFLVIPQIPFHRASQKVRLTRPDEIDRVIVDRFNSTYRGLEKRASADMREEGIRGESIKITYFLEMRYGGQLDEVSFVSPVSRIRTLGDMQAIIRCFEDEYSRLYSPQAMYPEGGLEIISIGIEVSAPMVKPRAVKYEFVSEDTSPAKKAVREVFFKGKLLSTPIYEMNALKCGNMIKGPAIIEGVDTTLVVDPDVKLAIDEYLNMVMEEIQDGENGSGSSKV